MSKKLLIDGIEMYKLVKANGNRLYKWPNNCYSYERIYNPTIPYIDERIMFHFINSKVAISKNDYWEVVM